MKLIDYRLNGKEYHLLLNGAALFDFYDRFGKDADMTDLLASEDPKSALDATLWMFAEFSLQGEMYRRAQGEDKGPYLSVRQAAMEIQPKDVPGLKLAIMSTIRAGFVRDHEDEAGYDPWLAELDQKKTMGLLAHGISGLLQRHWGSRRVRG